MNPCWEEVFNNNNENWEERYRWELNQDHLVFNRGKEKNLGSDYRHLLKVCEQLHKNSAFLVTIITTDERQLED